MSWLDRVAAGPNLELPCAFCHSRLQVVNNAPIVVLPADAAVATCGGRSRGQWKSSNQDAFLACPVASPSGASPALLLGVFDGHGCGGDNASHTAAGGLAGAVPAIRNQLRADAGWSRDGASASAAPVPQQALVRAFQAVAASMRYDSDFQDCGAAAVACLVEEDRCVAGG